MPRHLTTDDLATMLSDGSTLTTGLTFPNTGLHILDTNASHDLIIKPGSDLTADHTLTITTGDADRTLTINDATTLGGGSHSGTNTGDQTLPTRDSLGLDTDDSPQLAGINLGHATDTTITRVSAGVIAVEGTQLATGTGSATGVNTGDQTSIVGLTGTKAQFNTAVSDGDIVFLDSVDAITGAKTMSGLNAVLVSSSGLTVRNPANTFKYTITAAAIAADRVLNLPLITGTDTLATLGLAQTFSGATVFSSTLQITGAVRAEGNLGINRGAAPSFPLDVSLLAGGAGGRFNVQQASVLGTNDVFFQGIGATGAAPFVIEGYATAGIYLSTSGGTNVVILAPNRVEHARCDVSGFAVTGNLSCGTYRAPASSYTFDAGFALGGRFIMLETSLYGTNDLFFQGIPTTTSAAFVIEAFNSVGMFLSSSGGTTSIYIRPNRVDVVTVTTTSFACTQSIKSSHATGGIGYATGAGGTVTQLTSKATAFTLSKVCGTITFAGDALAANTGVASTWTNTAIAAADNVMWQHVSGGTIGAYAINCNPAAGSAVITLRNITGGSLTEAPVFRYSIIKGVTA